jgi:3-methylfumaryl-CoA hydratase
VAVSCDTRVDLGRVRSLQMLIDPDGRPLDEGDPLPVLWHWAALPSWTDPQVTGSDGHPRRPGTLGDLPAIRRMFAGGTVELGSRQPVIGERLAVSTELSDVTTKSGSSGDFTLATFRSTAAAVDGELLITERQDIVYTDPRESSVSAPTGALPIVGRALVGDELRTDPTTLLRFSAATANGHRIHYDLDYAREVEKLPGLLVHGPFMTLALVHVGGAGRRIRKINHRNVSPLFCGQVGRLSFSAGQGVVSGPDGDPKVNVRIEFEEP